MIVPQDTYWSEMHPTPLQELTMDEIAIACHRAYCWMLDQLSAGVYPLTSDNLYEMLDTRIKDDWIDARPPKICPWTTMRYVLRAACNAWLFVEGNLDGIEALKKANEGCLYIPHSGMKTKNSVRVTKVCRVKMDPIDIPTRVHSVIAHKRGNRWIAEIKAAHKPVF